MHLLRHLRRRGFVHRHHLAHPHRLCLRFLLFLALLKAVSSAVTIPVIASGGAGSVEDFAPAVLEGGASAVLAASFFHFGTHTIAEAHKALRDAGLPARGV